MAQRTTPEAWSVLAHMDDPEAVLRILLVRDFSAFLAKVFETISGGAAIDWNWHLEAIAFQLQRVKDGTCRRLLVTMPPRNLKSITISVAWVAWMLGHDPSLRFVCVSYSTELAEKLARSCRQVMESHWYRELFPGTVISKRAAVHDFETTRGGGRLATSITGTLTGRGGSTIIIDDPIKPDEAMSETVRNSVNTWYRTTLSSRLDDKATGSIITVMQRLHEEDLAGQMISDGGWDHLNLPAIADEDAIIPLTRGNVYLRRAGEALHSSRESLETLAAIRQQQGSSVFSAQYQQTPVPATGNMVMARWLQRFSAPVARQTGDMVVQSWDTATKDGIHNDWSVCITALIRGRSVYIIDVFRERLQFPQLLRAYSSLARDHQTSVILVEDAASGTQLIQSIRNEPPPGIPLPIACRPDTDKVTRLAAVTPVIESGTLLLPDSAAWLGPFESELLGFPNARHDDQVDALSQLLQWAGRRYRQDTVGEYPESPPAVSTTEYWSEDDFDDDDDYGVEDADLC